MAGEALLVRSRRLVPGGVWYQRPGGGEVPGNVVSAGGRCGWWASGADEHVDAPLGGAPGQPRYEVGADEAGGAGDEDVSHQLLTNGASFRRS